MNNFKLSRVFMPIDYGYTLSHQYIGDMANIGYRGENLTIVLLSCNRSTLTIKLTESLIEHVPDFGGEILIYDNASNKDDFNKLEKYLTTIPFKYRLIKSENNYGVAGGRNKAFKEVETEWIMSLDNDIYFIGNPFEICRKNIASLGCKFLNLPLIAEDTKKIFSNGGSFYILKENTDIHIWADSMYEQSRCNINEKFAPSLSTFLFGGSSIINKKIFLDCECFDEGMFVGFEDLDFSITLFKKGYKIGSAGILALVHDHKRLDGADSLEYEKVRFSNEKIFEAALYFEKKHAMKVWSKSTERWLKRRREEMGINTDKEMIQI